MRSRDLCSLHRFHDHLPPDRELVENRIKFSDQRKREGAIFVICSKPDDRFSSPGVDFRYAGYL